MTEISDEIHRKARRLCPNYFSGQALNSVYSDAVQAIAKAIMQEREACARIAEEYDSGHPFSKAISKEIRSGREPEEMKTARAIEICLSKLVLDNETARVLKLHLESSRSQKN